MTNFNTHDEPAMTLVALQGFHTAHDAYLAAAERDDVTAPEVFIPLATTLWWAVSTDEGFAKLHAAAYKEARAGDPNGRRFIGLRYARNRCGHQRALVVEIVRARTYPKTYPLTYRPRVRWRPSAELPPADTPAHEYGRDDYDCHLAGRPAGDTLRAMAAWFEAAQQRWPLHIRP